jgi:hypothetical protein
MSYAETMIAAIEAEVKPLIAERDALFEDNARLSKWVSDLQSGMYVNCVYCGHRYGPGETTPVSMADALKAHVEKCPKHPMSALKADNEWLREGLRGIARMDPKTEGDRMVLWANDTLSGRADDLPQAKPGEK